MISIRSFDPRLQICFCIEPEKIENYGDAMSDTSQVWECHHRLETHFSDGTERPKTAVLKKEELIALGMYYYRPAGELVFLTKTEHMSLHNKGRKNSPDRSNKKVICIETGEMFESQKAAIAWCGSSEVCRACRGLRKTAGGYHWKFA